jgi:hypothetical protein
MEEMNAQVTLHQAGTVILVLQAAQEEIPIFPRARAQVPEEHLQVEAVRLLLQMPGDRLLQLPVRVHSRAEVQFSRRQHLQSVLQQIQAPEAVPTVRFTET